MKYESFSESLEAPKLEYPDKFYTLKGTLVSPENGFEFVEYNVLQGVSDVRTNNGSNLILSKKALNSSWLEANTKKVDKEVGLATFLSMDGQYLYFDKTRKFYETNPTEIACKIVSAPEGKNYENYTFYIDFLSGDDEGKCVIQHTFSDIIFYLCCDADGSTMSFRKKPVDDNHKFYYHINGVNIILQKMIGEGNNQKKKTILIENGMLSHGEEMKYWTLKNTLLNFPLHYDNSYVSYDQSMGIQKIDSDASSFSLSGQVLLHHQVAEDSEINFIPLKVNQTYKGNKVRGDNYTLSKNIKYPGVNFRTYTNIHSGICQEKGTDNITLTFNFHDQEYEINDGDLIDITIPAKENNYGIEPLYPYTRLNINDTKFISCGAFGSDVPYYSDRFMKYQDAFSNIEGAPNNATYLCTWLFRETIDSEGIWVDRWYYPDKLSRTEALNNIGNVIDNSYSDSNTITDALNKETYVDKLSDVCLEAETSYKYSRISSADTTAILDRIADKRITTVEDGNHGQVDLGALLNLNNSNYLKLKAEKFQKTNALNFNCDLYLDPKKPIGIQLLGTDYKHGFTIQNRKTLAPFHYYASNECVYLLNNSFKAKHSFNLAEKYGTLGQEEVTDDFNNTSYPDKWYRRADCSYGSWRTV